MRDRIFLLVKQLIMHELMVGSGKSMPAEIMLIQAISYVDGRAIKLTVGYYQTMPS